MKRNDKCIYCNSIATTRDHVPPKIFLDPPLMNCTTVPACLMCNQNYGKEDEFIAYFIEFIRTMESGVNDIQREKIQKIFNHSSAIEDRIFDSIYVIGGPSSQPYIELEYSRIDSYLRRLAIAHIFLVEKQRLPLTAYWKTTFIFAKPLFEGFYEILGLPSGEKRFFRDNISWSPHSSANYAYLVSAPNNTVFIKIRDFFFAQASWRFSE